MTPLAMRLAKQLVLPVKDRADAWKTPYAATHLRDSLCDVHCFEVSAIRPIVDELAQAMDRISDDQADRDVEFFRSLSFLPAPKTWIELILDLKDGGKHRIGYLLEEHGDADRRYGCVTEFTENWDQRIGIMFLETDDWYRDHRVLVPAQSISQRNVDTLAYLHLILSLINSPKIMGRRQHMPHVGLERRLLGARAMVGKFPLHAWTEIKLQVNKPPEFDDGDPHEAHLTGQRALHFCRKHQRELFDKVVFVKAHWRGDPAIGIKQSRYVVTP